MKTCSRCSNTLAADAAYCYVCSTTQTEGFEEFELKPQYSTIFLKVLCILTIVGGIINLINSANSLVKGSALVMQDMKIIAYIGVILTIAKLIGAAFMLQKKLNGLYIYTVGAALGLLMMIYSVSFKWEYMQSVSGSSNAITIGSMVLAFFITISFPVMYWLPVNRRLLS